MKKSGSLVKFLIACGVVIAAAAAIAAIISRMHSKLKGACDCGCSDDGDFEGEDGCCCGCDGGMCDSCDTEESEKDDENVSEEISEGGKDDKNS